MHAVFISQNPGSITYLSIGGRLGEAGVGRRQRIDELLGDSFGLRQRQACRPLAVDFGLVSGFDLGDNHLRQQVVHLSLCPEVDAMRGAEDGSRLVRGWKG